MNCAVCEEPIPRQGVRCAVCRAPHHPKCFFGKGERCGVCQAAGTPEVFEVGAPPLVAARPRLRWSVGIRRSLVPLVLIAAGAWLWTFDLPKLPSRPRRDARGAIAGDPVTLSAAPAADPVWTEVPLPVDLSCTDVFLMVEAAVGSVDTVERTLHVEVGTDGASWQKLHPARLWPGCAWWYRFSSKNPFSRVRARVKAPEASAPWKVQRLLVLTRDAPPGEVVSGLRELTAVAVMPDLVVLGSGSDRFVLSSRLIDPGRGPAAALVLDPHTDASVMLAGPDRVGVGRRGAYACFGTFDLRYMPTLPIGPPELDEALATWDLTLGYWSVLHSWHCPAVVDAVGLPRSEMGALLLEDGRVATTLGHARAPEFHGGPEGLNEDFLAPATLRAFLKDKAAPRFRAEYPWRRPPATGDTFVILPSHAGCVTATPGLTLTAGQSSATGVPLRGPDGRDVTVPAACFGARAEPGQQFTVFSTFWMRLPPAAPVPLPKPSPRPTPPPVRVWRPALFGYLDPDGGIQVRDAIWGSRSDQVLARERAPFVSRTHAADQGETLLYRVAYTGRNFTLMYCFSRGRLFVVNLYLEPSAAIRSYPAEFRRLQQELERSYGKAREEGVAAGGTTTCTWNCGNTMMQLMLEQPRGQPPGIQIAITRQGIAATVR